MNNKKNIRVVFKKGHKDTFLSKDEGEKYIRRTKVAIHCI